VHSTGDSETSISESGHSYKVIEGDVIAFGASLFSILFFVYNKET
jgi:hypothetical protein